jgi:transcriptional regulator with XRE-family HTH domain
MGLSGRLSRQYAGRLERGAVENPSLGMMVLFRRACGASWSELFDLLEPIEAPEIDLKPIDESEFPDEVKVQMKDKLSRQVYKSSRKLPYSFGSKPEPPEQHRRTTEKLRNYRIVANIIEQAVKERRCSSREAIPEAEAR